MRKVIYIILALVLILSSFGVLGIASMSHNPHQICPFAIVSSNDCETIASATTSIFHHLTGFKAFTEVLLILGTSAILALLFVASIFFILSHFFTPRTDPDKVCQKLNIQKWLPVLILNPVLKWIALHNKRNTHLIFK